jgi:hypothetical protein
MAARDVEPPPSDCPAMIWPVNMSSYLIRDFMNEGCDAIVGSSLVYGPLLGKASLVSVMVH